MKKGKNMVKRGRPFKTNSNTEDGSKRTRVDYKDDFDDYFKEMDVEDVRDEGRRKRDDVLYFRRT